MSGQNLKERVEAMERQEILRALRESNGIMSRAARLLGITERMIGYKIRKYKIVKHYRITKGGDAVME